jgi:polyisoprenoid-binding protein YceI
MRHPLTLPTLPIAALACVVLLAQPAASEDATPGHPLAVVQSRITVSGTSNLHDWKVSADALRSSVTLPPGFLEGQTTTAPSGSFSLAATALRSDKARMNHLMWEALRAVEHPQLTFELRSARVKEGPEGAVDVEGEGLLTVAGIARPTKVTLRVRRQGGRLTLAGELPVLMSDFHISPPTALLGTLKTGDRVVIRVEATLSGEGG